MRAVFYRFLSMLQDIIFCSEKNNFYSRIDDQEDQREYFAPYISDLPQESVAKEESI